MFCISIKFISYNVSFKTKVSLLIFCVDDLSTDSTEVSGVFKSPIIIVLLIFSLCLNIYFIYLGTLVFGT